VEKKKPFLDSGLKIDDIARELSTNRTYLSKAINNQLETTFPNFINQYRIRESIRLILSGYIVNQTQEALATQSGFANRNVFLRAFKKHTGVLPSFFIANYKKWDQQKNRFNQDE
jgi:YesN/AraC family two-component response regulator